MTRRDAPWLEISRLASDYGGDAAERSSSCTASQQGGARGARREAVAPVHALDNAGPWT